MLKKVDKMAYHITAIATRAGPIPYPFSHFLSYIRTKSWTCKHIQANCLHYLSEKTDWPCSAEERLWLARIYGQSADILRIVAL